MVETQLESLQDQNDTFRKELEGLERLRQVKEKLDFAKLCNELKPELPEQLKLVIDKLH